MEFCQRNILQKSYSYDLLMKEKQLKIGEICTLNELKLNSVAEVVELKPMDKITRRRLLDMGLTKGVRIQIKKIAPLGDPMCFLLRGYELGLRCDELKSVVVRLVR